MIRLTAPSKDSRIRFGDFSIHWDSKKQQLQLHHFETQQLLWSTKPEQGWICASRKEDSFAESRGYFFLSQQAGESTTVQTVDTMEYISSENHVVLSGHLGGVAQCEYRMVFSAVDDKQIQIHIELVDSSTFNLIQLSFSTATDNQIFGFG